MFKVDYNLKLWISWHKYVLPCRLRQTRPFKIVVENKVEICVLLCHRNTALCRFGCPALRALTGIVCFNRMHSKKKPRAPALNENYASFSVSVTLISINIYAIRRAVQHTIKSVQFDNHRHSLWPLIFISATPSLAGPIARTATRPRTLAYSDQRSAHTRGPSINTFSKYHVPIKP